MSLFNHVLVFPSNNNPFPNRQPHYYYLWQTEDAMSN